MNNQEKPIDLSDIPEVTDISAAVRNPFAGVFKNGYTIRIEHDDYDEIVTVKRTRREKSKP